MRRKNGWVPIPNEVLKLGLSMAEFQLYIGSILLANPKTSRHPGLVDMSVRQVAQALDMASTTVYDNKQSLKDKGLIEFTDKGYIIIDYSNQLQSVLPAEQNEAETSEHGVPVAEQNRQEITFCEQTVPAAEHHSVPAAEQFEPKTSFVSECPPAEHPVPVAEQNRYDPQDKVYKKNIISNKLSPHGANIKKIFEGITERRGWNSPRFAAEAKSVKWMLEHEFTVEQILACFDFLKAQTFWQTKPLYLMNVQAQIGEWSKKHGKVGRYTEPEAFRESRG